MILIVSVGISGVVTGFSKEFLDLLGLDQELAPELALLAVILAGAADMLLFFAIFMLLVRPPLPQRSLWAGALLGAIGAGLLKWLSSFLIGLTKEQPAFQAFGIALILLVWINYFSRVVMYAAAWAAVDRPRRAELVVVPAPVAVREPVPPVARARPGHLVRRLCCVHARTGGAAASPPTASCPDRTKRFRLLAPPPASPSVALADRRTQVAVELGDHVEGDLLGARGGALADVGAAAEALVVVLADHVDDPAPALGLALGHLAEVGDLGAEEQGGRAVGAGRDAGAAADAGRGVEGAVGVVLGIGWRGRPARRRC